MYLANDDSFEDLAASVVKEIQDEALKNVEAGNLPKVEEQAEEVENPYSLLFTKIEFHWREEDKNALIQLRAASERVFVSLFGSSLDILEEFYKSIRVKEVIQGKTVYAKDSRGKFVEDWDQLDGQAVEKAIFDLQRQKILSNQQLSELFLEAAFAKYISQDVWHESYESLLEGTIGDRTARAQRDSRVDRYAAFFRFYIWKRAQDFQKELDQTIRLLERVVDWRIRRRT